MVFVLPDPLSPVFAPVYAFFKLRMPELERIAEPGHVRLGWVKRVGFVTFDVAAFERTRPFEDIDYWSQRISAIAGKTPEWVQFFSPLADGRRAQIAETPDLGAS